MNNETSEKITTFSFFGNLLIFFHHANLLDYYPEKITPLSVALMTICSKLAIPAMSWFFFISGYLFFRNLTLGTIVRKLRTRIRTVVVPFVIWNIFGVGLKCVKGVDVFSGGILDLIYNNFFFEFGGSCANGPLWYMFRLMEFALITPLIYLIIRHLRLSLVLWGDNSLEFY